MKPALMLAVALFPVLTSAQPPPLGPGRPPRGCNDFRTMGKRADWVAESVKKINPKANIECVRAVALELLGHIEVAWSNDVEGRGNKPRTVRKGQQAEFLQDLQDNARAQCSDRGGTPSPGQYETTKALLSFADDQSEWTSANYNALKRDVIRFAQGLAAAGASVSSGVSEALAVPANVSLPILNPELFMPAPTPESL